MIEYAAMLRITNPHDNFIFQKGEEMMRRINTLLLILANSETLNGKIRSDRNTGRGPPGHQKIPEGCSHCQTHTVSLSLRLFRAIIKA
jgi:hypothetical protein